MASLLEALKQYVSDAAPGGVLSPETPRLGSILDYGKQKANTLGSLLGDAAQTGAVAYTRANKPASPELTKDVLSFLPGIGDTISGYDAVQSAREGDWLGAGLNGIGLLPFVPAMGGMINPIKKQAKNAYIENKGLFDNLHKLQNLEFQAMPISDIADSVKIHRSPKYGTKAPSEYFVGIVNGEPAYIRKSDHWGSFTTNVKAGTPEAAAMGLADDVGDQFGRVGFKSHNWNLRGGQADANAERADQALAMRSAMTPEQMHGTGREREIADKLWDEYYSLTHSGKREAGYIPLSTLLEKKQP